MQAAPNVTMGQLGPMDRANAYNQPNNIQSMPNAGAPHMNQWQQQGVRPQQQSVPVLSQLQRQLSAGNTQQHNPYHQGQY